MQTVEMRNSVILSVKRAFLGVSPSLHVAVRWNENIITILCYYNNRRISEEDREAMSCVQTEVMADFPEFEINLTWHRYVHRYVIKPRKPLDAIWVYPRSENKHLPKWRANSFARKKGKIISKKLRSN